MFPSALTSRGLCDDWPLDPDDGAPPPYPGPYCPNATATGSIAVPATALATILFRAPSMPAPFGRPSQDRTQGARTRAAGAGAGRAGWMQGQSSAHPSCCSSVVPEVDHPDRHLVAAEPARGAARSHRAPAAVEDDVAVLRRVHPAPVRPLHVRAQAVLQLEDLAKAVPAARGVD